MIERAHGLVLRTRPFTETSLIVSWLTPEFGRIRTVAKGARRPKSPFRGKLDLFYEADFSFARSRQSDLHTLREISLRQVHAEMRHELGYLRQAAYCAGLIEAATETETPLPAIFDLMHGFLEALPLNSPQPQTIFCFELKLLDELGLTPDLETSKLTAGTRQLAMALSKGDWQAASRLRLSEKQAVELSRFLEGFLVFHLGKIPEGRKSAAMGDNER